MLIGIDASRAVRGTRTGTEHYSARLLEVLTRLNTAVGHRFTLYVNAPLDSDPQELFGFNLANNFHLQPLPFPRVWTHLRLSLEMAQHAPDVLFVPSHVVPLRHPASVVTIHDVGYLYYPEAHTRASRLYLHLSTRFSTRAARRIIAISQTTADDLQKHYQVPTAKIRVIPHGCDPAFQPIQDMTRLARTRVHYGIPFDRPYILYVGTLQPRKNLARLVDAYALALEQGRLGSPPPVLVLAGKKGWLYDSLFAQVQRRGLAGQVLFPGYVEQADLPALISGAAVFALPSLYEGFGLPALEAMACGTPLIAAQASSLPEVVGEAGLLVPPTDSAGWADALHAVFSDSSLATRLAGAGLARAAQFSWTRTARETLRVLEEAGPELYRGGNGPRRR